VNESILVKCAAEVLVSTEQEVKDADLVILHNKVEQ
jgi:hypothetical protein